MFAAVLLGLTLTQGAHLPKEKPVRPEVYQLPTLGSTLSEVTMRARVSGSTGTVTFPIPSDYSGQVIIAFKVEAEPASALSSWAVENKPDQRNRIVKIRIAPQNHNVTVSYVARVLVPGEPVTRTQTRDFSAWLGPSAQIQSRDAAVVEAAHNLRTDHPEQDELVHRVVKWVAANKVRQNLSPGSYDAVSALRGGGDSLGRANLCAAMLRASGIAARPIAYVPTWARNMDAERWLTEYGPDEGSWAMIDPTAGVQFPSRNSIIVLSVPDFADEDSAAAKSVALTPDVSRGTGPEISPELTWAARESGFQTTSLRLIRAFPRAAGGRIMIAGYRRSFKVARSMKAGKPEWFDEQEFNQALSKQLSAFALFLEHHR